MAVKNALYFALEAYLFREVADEVRFSKFLN